MNQLNQPIPQLPIEPKKSSSAIVGFAAVFAFACFLSFILFSENSSFKLIESLQRSLNNMAFQFSTTAPIQTSEPILEASPKPQATPIPFLRTTITEQYSFIRDGAVWVHNDLENKKISSEEQKVSRQVLSPDGQFLAYSWGDSTNSEYSSANTVTVVNLKTGISKNIHSIKDRVLKTNINDPNHKFVDVISKLTFSEDSRQIAFGTLEEIYVADTFSLQPRRVYAGNFSEKATRETALLYGFSELAFSPDKSRLFVQFQHYEAIGSYVLTLSTGSLTELAGNYSGYGSYVIGWIDSQHLATVTTGSDSMNAASSVFSHDIYTQDVKELLLLPDRYAMFVLDSKLYVATLNSNQNTIHPLTLMEIELDPYPI